MPSLRSAPRLFKRQRVLLQLVEGLGGDVGNLDLQKLLFLYCQDRGEEAPYDFVPYRFGAFSFTSYADRRKLIERGLLAPVRHRWVIEPGACLPSGHGDPEPALDRFLKVHRTLRGDALVAETYRRFPYFASRSEIAPRVLRADPEALARVERSRPKRHRARLYTIGYEGRSLESYLDILLRSGVDVLCDVRRNPLSRKYGFSKRALASACAKLEIRYEHLPALGIASADRKIASRRGDFAALFAKYERTTLVRESLALADIRRWVDDGESVALTCYEHQAVDCHRHCVASALSGMEVIDLQ